MITRELVVLATVLLCCSCGKGQEKRENRVQGEKVRKQPEYAGCSLKTSPENVKLPANEYTFRMLNSSPGEFVDMELTVYGYAELAEYYNWGYAGDRDRYYSVCVYESGSLGAAPGHSWIHVYFLKKEHRDLFEFLGRSECRAVPMEFRVVQHAERYGCYLGTPCKAGEYLAEGLGWSLPGK